MGRVVRRNQMPISCAGTCQARALSACRSPVCQTCPGSQTPACQSLQAAQLRNLLPSMSPAGTSGRPLLPIGGCSRAVYERRHAPGAARSCHPWPQWEGRRYAEQQRAATTSRSFAADAGRGSTWCDELEHDSHCQLWVCRRCRSWQHVVRRTGARRLRYQAMAHVPT
jgi:hypothetical protein